MYKFMVYIYISNIHIYGIYIYMFNIFAIYGIILGK